MSVFTPRRSSPTGTGTRATAGVLLPGFAGTELPGWLERRLRGGLAGVCLFGENIASREQLRRLTAAIRAANPLALIAIDEEGGDVTRLYYAEGSPFPGNAVLGRLDDARLTARVGAAVAAELADVGVNLNFAPDADVNADPENPVIGVRSFGADAGLVARHTAAWTAAHEGAGVATAAKHFPGHGDVAVDSHVALPVVELGLPELRERELEPFRAAIAAGARTIMTSHILLPRLDPERPATFSPVILQDVLRGEMGFDGVIVSDALDMRGASGRIGIPEAAVRAIGGGCDLLCVGPGTTERQVTAIEAALVAAVADGRLSAARIEDAGRRVSALAASLGDAAQPASPVLTPGEPPLDAATIEHAFDGTDGLRIPAGAVIVQFETATNIAVGTAPWGAAAAGAPVATVREGEALPPGTEPLVLVGKDLHRHAWVRALIAEARATRPTVTIDMGWPSPDRKFADVATFGASRAVGDALVRWLTAMTKGAPR